MRIVGPIPDDEEDKLELMYVAKMFVVGQKVRELAQKSRRKNENNNEKKSK